MKQIEKKYGKDFGERNEEKIKQYLYKIGYESFYKMIGLQRVKDIKKYYGNTSQD